MAKKPEIIDTISTVDDQVATSLAAADEAPAPQATGVDDRVSPETPAATVERVRTFLADARYFLSTLEHEVVGEGAEIIAYLKQKLL